MDEGIGQVDNGPKKKWGNMTVTIIVFYELIIGGQPSK